MFLGTGSGSKEDEPWESPSTTSIGVRNLGLELQGGMWALPTFSPALQPSNMAVSNSGKLLAGFALAAHNRGMPLPEKPFTTVLEALTEQFQTYLNSRQLDVELLPMGLRFIVEDHSLHMVGIPVQRLPLIRLKPFIEEINSHHPELGWYLSQTIGMGHCAGLPVYDPVRLASISEYSWFYCTSSDEDMAAEVFEEEITKENRDLLIAQLHEEYSIYPSIFSSSLGGNAKLWSSEDPSTSRRFESKVQRAINSGSLSASAAKALCQALEFNRLLKVQASLGVNFNSDLPEGDQIGALAFVVWDETDLMFELINHYEQSAYEGDSYEELIHLTFDLGDQDKWPLIIDAIKAYVDRFVSFSNLLSIMEDKDF